MHAVISTGGKQYRVAAGDEIYIEKLGLEDGAEVKFENVLCVIDGDDCKVGSPNLAGASVLAKVVKSGKAKKIMIFKMKAKKNYRRRQGHRQPYTKIKIESISV